MNWTLQNTDAWEPRGPDDDPQSSEPSGSRRWLLAFGGAFVAVLAVASYFGYQFIRWLMRPLEYCYGGIWCREVRTQWGNFRAGKLPRETMQKINEHLSKCPHCSKMLQRIQPAKPRSLEKVATPTPPEDDG